VIRRIPRSASPLDLRPNKWRPSEERQAQMDDLLWDGHVMRVYCDCSISHTLKAFGIAASFVYDGAVLVRSKKVYDRRLQLQPTYGELQAVLFAIRQIESVLTMTMNVPDKIAIYSDVDKIDHLLTGGKATTYADCSHLISMATAYFNTKWPGVDLDILYLPPEEQRYNPYYASAHNAARKEVSLKR
jgi:hypothetical protein